MFDAQKGFYLLGYEGERYISCFLIRKEMVNRSTVQKSVNDYFCNFGYKVISVSSRSKNK
jgi:hypothetical protein